MGLRLMNGDKNRERLPGGAGILAGVAIFKGAGVTGAFWKESYM
jgi:hypothetical protein